MMDVVKLYPQYNIANERRQQKTPVSFERRSGIDRRSDDRVKLDTNLTRDIFEIKNKVEKIQGPKQKMQVDIQQQLNFGKNIPTSLKNSINSDQFVKTVKPNNNQSAKEIQKSKSDSGAIAGVLATLLGGTLASTFLGVAGVGIAIGIGAYFGGRVLKNAIVSHLKNK